jgi:hypothetical protein
MIHKKIAMEHDKKIALVAHDNKKRDLVEWAEYNRTLLDHHTLFATGTTGEMLEQKLGFKVTRLQSGPLGGDLQIGAGTATPRSGCQGTLANGGGVEYSYCLQSLLRRFHDFLPLDGWRL